MRVINLYDTFCEDPLTLQFKEKIDLAPHKIIEFEDRRKKQLKMSEEYSDVFNSFKYDDVEKEEEYLSLLKFNQE